MQISFSQNLREHKTASNDSVNVDDEKREEKLKGLGAFFMADEKLLYSATFAPPRSL